MNKPSLRNAVLLGLLATAGIARPAEVFAWEGIYLSLIHISEPTRPY